MRKVALAAVLGLMVTTAVYAESRVYEIQTAEGLELHNVTAEPVSYDGRKALRVVENARGQSVETMAVIPKSNFRDGVIEAEVAGKPKAGANEGARGFVGIAFRVGDEVGKYECFYIRPTNGRANDQLRRNHATQYISHPEFPWHKLRKENPGVYESYADMVSGAWTKLKIEVTGSTARLYVNGASQPALIVNDLKHGASEGRIALWIGDGTEAYFSDVTVKVN